MDLFRRDAMEEDEGDIVFAQVPGPSATETIEGGQDGFAAVQVKEDPKLTQELFLSVFSNGLITDNILSWLNFGDLKMLRQVSRHFFEKIEAYKRYKNAGVLCLTKETLLKDGDIVLSSDQAKIWRGIKVDLSQMVIHRPYLVIPRHILHNLDFVSLISEDLEDNQVLPPLNPLILHVLRSALNISRLQFDVRFLEKDLRGVLALFHIRAVREPLESLKHLDILGPSNSIAIGNEERSRRIIASGVRPIDEIDVTWNFVANLTLFSRVFHQLEILHVAKVKLRSYVFYSGEFNYRNSLSVQKAIVELLQENQETLKELSLHLDFWHDDRFGTVSLPRLTCLNVTVLGEGQKPLSDFLANTPSLETLDLAVVQSALGWRLFESIKRRSANLKKFHLQVKMFCRFFNSEGSEERVDWSFLGGMGRLKDFQLSRPTCENARWPIYGTGTRVLQELPRNQLERLGFEGIGERRDEWGFWKTRLCDREPRNGNVVYFEPNLGYKLKLLRGFRNLKRLSFNRCLDAVDNDIMRLIVSEMTSLEEFEVSHCSRLTDAGFAGKSEDGSDSIRNLRLLKELSIGNCPLVTPKGLLSCLRLPFLRRLDYVAEKRVPKSFVLQIISQNRSLESVAVNFDGFSKEEVLKEVKDNPPLKTLIDLCERESDDDSDNEDDVIVTDD